MYIETTYSPDSNYTYASPISDFFDENGKYTIAYDNEEKGIIEIMHPLGTPDKVTITRAMPKVGGVTCDSKGNLYVAYGDIDEAGKGKICTFAVYKYSRKGKLLGKAEYYPTDLDASTRGAFTTGNCAMEFQGDLLICSYGRIMYSEHQSNAVFCVDTETMTENPLYDSYTSHSFNQSVLVMDEHTVVFADHGDAYPRGFAINIVKDKAVKNRVIKITEMDDEFSDADFMEADTTETDVVGEEADDELVDDSGSRRTSVTPFQFYGETGDNYTNAFLAGIAKVNTGVALVGASAKEYSAEYKGAPRQLFMQVIDVESGKSILKGDTRADGSKGIVWLTNYTDGSTVGSANAAALDDSRLLVMWERWRKGEFVNSYYSIVKSDGTVVTDSVPMQYARINGSEELKTDGTTAYWTYAEVKNYLDAADSATFITMDNWLDNYYAIITNYTLLPEKPSVASNSVKDAKVTLAYEQKTYTGKALKPAVTVEYNGEKLKKGTDYTVTYKNNKNIGTASVIIKGKGSYSGKKTVKFTIIPKAVSEFTVIHNKSNKTLKWSAVKGAAGYEVRIIKYVKKDGDLFEYDKAVTKTTKKTSYTHKVSENRNVLYNYTVRSFVRVNGVKVYSEWYTIMV